MSATVLYMSMSLDGFIAGPNAGPENALGDGGERLHDWVLNRAQEGDGGLPPLTAGGVSGGVVEEFMATGAVVAGAGTFEPANGWHGDHHDGVPIFILSRHLAPPPFDEMPLVTYVDDVASALGSAKEAAGDRNVLVHGDTVARLGLAAGMLDELEIHLVPIFLGGGRRLFDGLPSELPRLERTRALAGEGGVTHLHYRVR